MKRILLTSIFVLIANILMQAQVSPTNSDFEFRGGKFYQNGAVVSPDQLSTIIGQPAYDKEYKSGKGMRTSGIVLLSVGGAATALGTGLAIAGIATMEESSGGSAIEGVFGVVTASCGIVVTVVGGILLGVGNKKLKNIRPASNGAGLAWAF